MCCMLCVIKSPKKSLLGGPRLPKLQPFVLKIPRASGIVYVLGPFLRLLVCWLVGYPDL